MLNIKIKQMLRKAINISIKSNKRKKWLSGWCNEATRSSWSARRMGEIANKACLVKGIQ
jgi:hypothetical protein